MWPVVKALLQTPKMMFASTLQQKEETTEGPPTHRLQVFLARSGPIGCPTWGIIISADVPFILHFPQSGVLQTMDPNHAQFPFALREKCLTSPLIVMGNLTPTTATLMPLKN